MDQISSVNKLLILLYHANFNTILISQARAGNNENCN